MKYILFSALACVLVTFTAEQTQAKSIPAPGQAMITLATGGQAKATIIIPAKANAKQKLAAKELQHYVKAICGVLLPVHKDGKRVDGTGLYIGKCAPTKQSDLPDKKLNPESFIIKVRGGDVYFNGRWPTTTYWAVDSFIENNLGVRWFAPGELWIYVPKGKEGELSVKVHSHTIVPDTSPRIWSGNNWFPNWHKWNLRNKTQSPDPLPLRRHFQNNVYKIFPPSKYAESHPEYYPMINGERWIPPSDSYRYWMPEMSNPDVIRKTAEYIHRYFQKHPDQKSFSLGADDVHYWSDKDRANLPDSYYKFVNAVAKRLQKTDPGKYVGCLIYRYKHKIPKTIDHLEPNVFGFITQTCFEWWQPGNEAAAEKLSRQWAEICDHLSRYDYYGMGTMTPRFAPHYMAQEIKFDKSLGFEGMYAEVYTFWPDTAPMMWALAKMQWNSSLNVDDLLNTFYKDMYGSAAVVMHKYFDLLEHAWTQNRPGRTHKWVHRNIIAQAQAMTPEQLDKGMALLDKALSVATSSKVKKRIEINRAGLRYGGYVINGYALAQRIAKAKVTDAGSANQMLGLAKKLSMLTRQQNAFWAKASKRNDLLGQTVRGLGDKMGYLQIAEANELENRSTLSGAFKALDWFSKHDTPAAFRQRLERLKKVTTGVLRQAVSAFAAMSSKGSKNLIHNGDFQTPGRDTSKVKKDWTTHNAPAHWSFWSHNKNAKYGVAAGKGRNGSSAIFIKNASSAVFIQTISAKPGQTYFLTGWIKVTSTSTSGGSAQIGVRFETPGGSWADKNHLSSQKVIAGKSAIWQRVMMLITIPKGVGRLVIMPGARGETGSTTAWFDNIALYQVK